MPILDTSMAMHAAPGGTSSPSAAEVRGRRTASSAKYRADAQCRWLRPHRLPALTVFRRFVLPPPMVATQARSNPPRGNIGVCLYSS
jgi:hypothetical protein